MNTYHVAGRELVNTNVYGQLMAWQELMSSSKQPRVEPIVIPISRWSPAVNKDSNVPEITQKEVDSLGIHLYPLPPKVVWSLGAASVGFSCALTEPGSSASGLAPVNVPVQSGLLLDRAMTLPFRAASFS